MTARPRLRADLVIVPQQYRGEETFIVKDPGTHKYFRFKPLEVLVMQQFTGEHTTADLADALRAQGVPLTPTALAAFREKLSRMGLLERSLHEKSTLQLERLRAERHRRVKQTHYEGSVLRMRWSVGDPDELFDRWLPRLRFMFRPPFLVASAVLFVIYFVILAGRWGDIASGIVAMYTADFYTLENIVLFWGTAMVVVAIHELGHGLSCKYFGGHVHEMGAMLIYFQPAFYCNVNDAWTFPKLSHRLWVTAAGSWIQLVVAGIAAIVWIAVDPSSVVSRIAFFAVLVGGATTILANANPLIPLDGYYALSDYLEIPNLRQRAFGHVAWLVKRYVLRLNVPEPPADARERRIFITYGTLALLYITTILTIVALLVMGWASRALGAIGVLAFLLLLWALLRDSLREWGRAVANAFREHRGALSGRMGRRILSSGAVLLLLGLVVPWPIAVTGAFVAAPPFEVVLTPQDNGVLETVFAPEGGLVTAGAPVARLRNYALERQAARLERAVDSLHTLALRHRGIGQGPAAQHVDLALRESHALLDAARERVAALTLRAPVTGVVLTPRLADSTGLWFDAGVPVAVLGVVDSIEVRIRLDRAGATLVAPGNPVDLITRTGTGRFHRGAVASVSTATNGARELEARLRFPSDTPGMRLGVTGLARVTVRRSNLLGALWWRVRKLVRSDLLL